MNDADGNLSVEASLIMPIFIIYILIVIGSGIYIYKTEVNNLKDNKGRIVDYEPNFNTQKTIYEL